MVAQWTFFGGGGGGGGRGFCFVRQRQGYKLSEKKGVAASPLLYLSRYFEPKCDGDGVSTPTV